MEYQPVLDFWFKELSEGEWFHSGEKIDRQITERFADLHVAVAAGECAAWRAHPEGALAEILVLDQFSRNLFRGQAEAFACDGQALVLAQVMIDKDFDQELSERLRVFCYLPFMHSESSVIHEQAVKLFTDLGNEEALNFEHIHKDIIEQFGRYPHRNAQLGRESTPEEIAYLEDADQAFFKS